MSKNNLDFIADVNGVELNRLVKLYEFPDFVKNAAEDNVRTDKKLASNLYGDPVRRQFPCHSSASTWLSNLYFTEKQSEYHPEEAQRIRRRLTKFAEYQGILSDTEKIQQTHATLHKQAEARLPDRNFAYVWKSETGEKVRKLRIDNEDLLKQAAQWLETNRDKVDIESRRAIAKRISEKRASLSADLGKHGPFIERQLGQGFSTCKEALDMLDGRAIVAKTAGARNSMKKLRALIANNPAAALHLEGRFKLAETVHTFDQENGLIGKYTENFKRPEDVLFRLTTKQAEAGLADACAVSSGNVYDKNHFKCLRAEDVSNVFGESFAKAASTGFDIDADKLAKSASVLSREGADMFDRLMASKGVAPVITQAATQPKQLLQHF